MSFERHHVAWIGASLITVVSFVGATAYTQNRLAVLDSLSSMLETNSVPSIEYLSRAAVRLTRLNQLMNDLAGPSPRRAAAVRETQSEVAALGTDVDRYLHLPPLAGEGGYWMALRRDVDRARGLIQARVAHAGPVDEATADQLDDAIDAAVRSVLATLAFDVRRSEVTAGDVRRLRQSTLRMIVELDAVATAIAFFAVFVAFRASRRHDDLLNQHNNLLSDRVTELDRFAGRVAHDILSPLGTIAAALGLLGHTADERGRTYIERSQRALQRVQQLVDGLLTFARAGARPDPSASCSIGTVIAGITADCREAAAIDRIDLATDIDPSLRVACSEGVVTSVLENLVRNAIKYIGSGPVRRITVRAKAAGGNVRLEVEDTGPGIPQDIESTLFQPFVRGPNEQASGTGLGLATVKRLVESHGGSVGVESKRGAGTLFWVELPRAEAQEGDASFIDGSPAAMLHDVRGGLQ